MDIQGAIKSLQNIVEYWSCRPSEVEAAEVAILALEKQIPKTPTPYKRYSVYFCPRCRGSIWYKDRKITHCFRCGQKIDWEDE